VLELDLREPTGLERSHFLHRLALLDLPWGRKGQTPKGKGTFKENWTLEWKPEFAVEIIDAARFGNTVETAATGAVATKAAAASLDVLCVLLENTLLAELPAAATALLQRIAAEAAQGDDVLRLARAVPALARLARYGSVRQTDASAVVAILDGFSARIHVGLSGAVAGIDDDAAETWRRAVADYHAALALIESTWLDDWRTTLKKLLDSTSTHALIAGATARLLLDGGQLTSDAAARELGLALSRGQEPAHAAAWIEGFLRDQGAVLVHDDRVLPLLEDSNCSEKRRRSYRPHESARSASRSHARRALAPHPRQGSRGPVPCGPCRCGWRNGCRPRSAVSRPARSRQPAPGWSRCVGAQRGSLAR
jgi:hypothetical protein